MAEKKKTAKSAKTARNKTSKKTGTRQAKKTAPSKRADHSRENVKETSKRSLPIVGIGASAGGLEALEELFANMPADSGIAFVLIAHLSPDHDSMLPELLQRKTKLTVQQIRDNMKVMPDNIYVIPPKKQVAILNGRLFLSELDHHPGLRLPIDSFLRSLAQDQQQNAVGIILSGTGTDGTLGIKEIKGHAGMVMVQDESSAKYAGMPRSAIDTGMADFILPPDRMPEQLINFFRHSTEKKETVKLSKDRASTAALQKIFILLRSHTNHDFTNYKQNTIVRRIERRMHVHQIDRIRDYVVFLEQNPQETKILFKDLLIGVTSFFRDPEAFAALKKCILQQIQDSSRPPSEYRVWVPGCSSGEEAYSIAIILQECMEEMNRHFSVQIFGTDLDDQAVATAREGVYPASIASDLSPERLKRFLIREGDSFRIKKNIREMLVFAPQNIIKDPPFTKLDLLCCRNLMIYLNTAVQRKILPLFHYSLKPNGILCLGTSETIGQAVELFDTLDRKWKIFKKKKTIMPQPIDFSLDQAGREIEQTIRRQDHTPTSSMPMIDALQLVETILRNSGMPPCAVIDENGNIIYTHGRTARFLEIAPGRINFSITEMGRTGLKHELASLIRKAISQRKEQHLHNLTVRDCCDEIHLDLIVQPITEPKPLQGLLLVIFKENTAKKTPGKQTQKDKKNANCKELERELRYTREDLQSSIEELEASNEELKSTNEELQSTNEELQSTNEELETSKEELQSLNEESVTVNAELHNRIDELASTNDDLKNLIDTSLGSTVFVDTDFCISFFTRPVTRIIKLVDKDKGRPIDHFALNLKNIDLRKLAADVLENLHKKEIEAESRDGRFYIIRISPYRTVENIINGVVFSFEDITRFKKMERKLADEVNRTRSFAENIVDTVRESLLVLDSKLVVNSANRSFYRTFQVDEKDTLGRRLYSLGDSQWDIPDLRRLLEEILPRDTTVESFLMEHHFPHIGHRRMVLNARRLQQAKGGDEAILLAIEDITNYTAA